MNHFTVTSVSIFLCLAMTLSLCRAGSAEEQTLLQKLPLRIHNKTLTQSEYLACQRAAQTSKQFTHEFRVQTATIQREFFGNPAKSIDCIASDLFSPELYQQWHSENIAAYTDRLKHYQKECSVWRQNKRQNPKTDLTPPIPPHTIQQDLPSISQWRITPQSAPAAMEAARCLHHVGKTQSALAIIDFIGQNSDVIGRIFASECLGDIFVDQHFFEKALTAYNHALRFKSDHEQQFSPGEIEKNSTFNQQIAPLVQRIQQKRSALLKQIERDRYGEDWTAYRDAEVARKTNQHFLHAIESYQIVQHISQESMFQDAAEFGIIQCFFFLLLASR